MRFYQLSKLDKPLIVLIGGTTGVGKSTIATEVAHRLGITRIVSTDSIREVMRGIFTKDLMPAIYESAFNAWRGLRVPVPHGANPVIVGFREQTAVVTTGVKALIDRSVLEGDSLVLEGVHLVPGYLEPRQFKNARVVQLVITVEDEDSASQPLLHPRGADRRHAPVREVPGQLRQHPVAGSLHRGPGTGARHPGDPRATSWTCTVADVLEHIVDAVMETDAQTPG